MSEPMHPMLRAAILTVALALGLAAALVAGRGAGDTGSTPFIFVAGAQAAPTHLAQAPSPDKAPEPPSGAPRPAPQGDSARAKGVDVEITVGEKGATVREGDGRSRIVVGDSDLEGLDNLVINAAPVALVAVLSVFLTPLIVIGLVIWYKMRRARMLNETMLKLAERGVVPPAEAMQALASGASGPAAVAAAPSTAPLYEQARSIRRRTAWSDLRKGVLMTGVGLGLSAWSLFEDGTSNGFGLILLFVGIGYCVLWYFEERKVDPRSPLPPRDGGP